MGLRPASLWEVGAVSLTVVRTLPEEGWRRCVDEHPQGNIFHTPEMFLVFARAKGHHPTLWATVDRDGHVLALLLPVQITLLPGLFRRFTTRAVAYGGVLCAPGAEGQAALALLLQTYIRQADGAPLFTELRNLTSMETVQRVLQEHGFAYEDHLNYLIDLHRPPEAIFQGIGSRTRKNIRRGLKQGEVIIEEVKEREQVIACYEVLRKTYQAAQVPLADCSLFEAAFDVLFPKGMIRFTLARVGETPAAVSVELLYKNVVYGWYGGVDREYTRYVPNELLMWHILQWSAEHGHRTYDFGGAGRPDEEYGVRDFKAKFGGKLVCFGRNTCIHAPRLLWLSEQGYHLLRRWF